jgi:hypothetical protein
MDALQARLRERQRRGEVKVDSKGNITDRESRTLAQHVQVGACWPKSPSLCQYVPYTP